jgi:hypothetical protein
MPLVLQLEAILMLPMEVMPRMFSTINSTWQRQLLLNKPRLLVLHPHHRLPLHPVVRPHLLHHHLKLPLHHLQDLVQVVIML